MRAYRLDGIVVGALLALSMTPLPATAQQADALDARIPVIEPADVPPPTSADAGPQASTQTPAQVPVQRTATPPASAQPVQAAPAVPAQQPVVVQQPVSVQPAAAQPTAAAPAAAPTTAGGIPLPEPADVPPPTKEDIGKVQLSAADQAVADRLRALVSGRLERVVEEKSERTALKEFYETRDYAPLWVEYGSPSDRAKAAVARLKRADADGLDASDYVAPDLARLGPDPDAVADAELKLTAALMKFARHAQSGRVTISRISPNIDWTAPVPEADEVLATFAEAKDMAAALDAFNPPHEGFRRLKAKLTELRGSPEDHVVEIPKGPNLRKGKKDKRVPLLRARLKVEGDSDSTVYDAELVDAVKAFQRSRAMSPTGIVNQPTVDALNGRSKGRDISAIVSNMERWRWMPRELGTSYVMVNVPDYTLKTVHNGKVIFTTRIVTGKPSTPSPSFSAKIENILVNPSWHVPQSIIYGQYLPALEQDPSALTRMGMVVSRNRDGSISVKQPPGERNALGRIKFNFSNKFQVYLHDTPQKHLFKQDMRAHSAGCMRVQDPAEFAEVLLSIGMPDQNYTSERITRMYGKGEQWLRFKKTIPVHLVYLNAYVEDDGKLVVKPDVYGYDGRVQSALNGKYLQVAERSQVVIPGKPNPAVRVARVKRPDEVERRPQPQQQGFFLFDLFRNPSY